MKMEKETLIILGMVGAYMVFSNSKKENESPISSGGGGGSVIELSILQPATAGSSETATKKSMHTAEATTPQEEFKVGVMVDNYTASTSKGSSKKRIYEDNIKTNLVTVKDDGAIVGGYDFKNNVSLNKTGVEQRVASDNFMSLIGGRTPTTTTTKKQVNYSSTPTNKKLFGGLLGW